MGERSKLRGRDRRVLLHNFDRKEQVIRGGMGVKGIRVVWERKPMPEWMSSDKAVEDFLRREFPHVRRPDPKCTCTSCKYPDRGIGRGVCACRPCLQATRAAKWALVIRHWFVGRKSDTEIESEQNWKPDTVGYIVQRIRRAIAGQRRDGVPRSGRPRGRPRTNPANVQTLNEELAGRRILRKLLLTGTCEGSKNNFAIDSTGVTPPNPTREAKIVISANVRAL